MKGKPNTRGDKVNLSFGVMSIPVQLFGTAVSDHGISRSMFVEVEGEEDHPVGYLDVDKITGDKVKRADVVKKIATEHGFVYVEDGEIEQLFSVDQKSLTVVSVHPMNQWRADVLVPKKSWQIEAAPIEVGKKKMPNKSGQISLQALLDVLREKDAFAMCDLVTRGIPKPAVLLPTGDVVEVAYEEEMRERREPVEFKEADLVKVEKFYPPLQAMLAGVWSDEVTIPSDTRTALIQQFAEEKAAAGDFAKPKDVEAVEPTAVDDTDALLAMLQASLTKPAEATALAQVS